METWIYVAGWTLVHFLWQGAVIGGGAAVGLYLLRGGAPNVRYVFASTALILMPLSLIATASLVSLPPPTPLIAPASPASSTSPAITSFVASVDPQQSDARQQHPASANLVGRLPRAFPVIVITWLTGVTILLVRLLGAWWHVRAMQRVALTAPPSRWQEAADRLASRLGVSRRVCVADAETVETPTVIGWWRPVIVLPLAALSGLTPSQTDAILMHELAHIRRHDYLVNLLQHVTETVLFYHPAVWWLSGRMRVEREQCCDAIVVDICADPLDYATALTRLEEARQTDATLAVAATDGMLIDRVRRLLGARADREAPTVHALATATIIALVIVVVGGGYRWSTRILHATSHNELSLQVVPPPAPLSARDNPDGVKSATKAPVSSEVAVRQRRVEDARQSSAVSDISLAVEVNYFQLNRAEYSVPISVRIPGSELALARTRGAARTTIDLSGEVTDDFGIVVQNVHDTLDVVLGEDSVATLADRPIQYETAVTLLPGKYAVGIQVRDAATGRTGTSQTSLTIPNLNRELGRIPISTVVLGSRYVRLGDDVPNNANPLVHDGLKLVPSVTRVFSKAQDMYVFLEAYEHDATTMQPLVAFVTLYRGDTKAFETAPLSVTDGLEGRAKAVPLRFSIPLGDLTTGRYDCEVTVRDPDGQKVTSWRAPVELVP